MHLSRATPWLGTTARIGLGVVWLVAGALKFPDPAAAERAVRAYQLLPEALVGPVAFGLPALEVLVGLALVAGVAVRAAAVTSAVVLVVFIAAVSSAWARGLQIDCGCFGGGGQVEAGETAYLSEVLRDVALLAVAAALARWPRTRLALRSVLAGPPIHHGTDDPDPDDTDPDDAGPGAASPTDEDHVRVSQL
ncbi:MauE/DoxX family redox-associated membrane protein [Modestobacter sp. Leaf380]|uniref:MauE/DoxX family redox-associated membrane protein n=1 Tax=Modestobacter sp. Leaf380 TaxID=1736356 RepID=UPI001F3592C3|nr:MauE/DoxX family redox-associated membrane protein [Modestobacter sp. Leaf380]